MNEKEKLQIERDNLKRKVGSLNDPHPIFREMTNAEVIQILGEQAFKARELPPTIEMSKEAKKALAKNVFRVDLK